MAEYRFVQQEKMARLFQHYLLHYISQSACATIGTTTVLVLSAGLNDEVYSEFNDASCSSAPLVEFATKS